LRGPGSAITARHLLSHSSGLANPPPVRWVRPAGAPPPDAAMFLDRLLQRHRRLPFPPGDPAAYSNLGHLLPRELVASSPRPRPPAPRGPRRLGPGPALRRVRRGGPARAAGDEPHRFRARPGASRRRNRLLAASAGRAGRPAPDAPAGDRRPAHPWPGVLPAVL